MSALVPVIDDGSNDHLVARINRQLSQDAASGARAELAVARQLGQAYTQELAGNSSAQQEMRARADALAGEASTLTEQMNQYTATATSLGFVVGSSFPDIARAVELQQSRISEELAHETESNRAIAVDVDNAQKSKNAASSALAVAAAKEDSLKQRLDGIRRMLDTLRGDPRASSPTFDVPLPELSPFESDAASSLETTRLAHAALTESRAAALAQIEIALKEEAKKRVATQAPLRWQAGESLERDRARHASWSVKRRQTVRGRQRTRRSMIKSRKIAGPALKLILQLIPGSPVQRRSSAWDAADDGGVL